MKSFKLGIFPFLLVPNIRDSQAFHFFDCLWRLNLKIFKIKKQIWLHVFNDFKSFLAKGIKLTFKHHDWRKEVVQMISFCSFFFLKKERFFLFIFNLKKKTSFYIKFLFKKKKEWFQKKNSFFKIFVRTTFGPDPLWERYVGNLSKGPVIITKKKKHLFKGSKSRHFFVWI